MSLPRSKLPILAFAVLVALSAAAMAQPVAGQEAASVGGRVIQDVDGDGAVSHADVGAETLIDLQDLSVSEDVVAPSLFTDAEGRFEFRFVDTPAADQDLWVWWSPGFIDPESRIDSSLEMERPHDGVVIITLPAQRIAAGEFQDLVLLVNPRDPEGPIPYPVRSGQESLPVGIATVTVDGAGAGDTALPGTGTGGASSAVPWPVIALATLAAAGVVGVAVALARRKGRISAR